MSKLRKLWHRIHLTFSHRWFLAIEKDWKRFGIGLPRVVFDVGAHLGQTTLHFRKVFPSANVHSFEPFPENFRRLELKTKGKDRIQINQTALGSTTGFANMQAGHSDQAHSIRPKTKLEKNPAVKGKMPKVELSTIDSYLQKEGISNIDLLKIDVEGYELEVLKGAENALEKGKVQAVLAECDFDPEDTQHTYFNDLWNFMMGKNFSFFGLYDVIHYENGMGIGFCNALFVRKPLSLAKETV